MVRDVLVFAAVAYVLDVVVRPNEVARAARAAAIRRGKRLLNVGCGTPGSSMRVALLGPTAWGDVNCDVAATAACTSRDACTCDIMDLPWEDKAFGAVIASHVLEHVPDPTKAMRELERVADEVFVITPPWWAPHTWLHPGHRWYVRADGSLMPLWRG
jgi:ubiquinone/menaquinone biosynthesis C-methylase UbiE